MRAILSRPVPEFDISSASFRAAARDVGEVVALLAGGLRPDPETVARLGLSMRVLQGFLLAEAAEQEGREAAKALLLAAVAAISPTSAAKLFPDEVTP